jgi:hypothetical protein
MYCSAADEERLLLRDLEQFSSLEKSTGAVPKGRNEAEQVRQPKSNADSDVAWNGPQ